MTNLDYAIREFNRRICSKCVVKNSVSGHSGLIAVLLEDKSENKQYWLQYKKEWLGSFSALFNVPEKGIGQSFSMSVIEKAKAISPDSMIVFAMPKTGDLTFYGTPLKEIVDYIQLRHTIRPVNNEISPNCSIPIKMCKNLEKPA